MNIPAPKHTIILIFVISLLVTNGYTVSAQCPVTAFASSMTINCGDTVALSALAGGCTPLNNDFNSGVIGTDWSASPGGVVTDGTGAYACAGPPPEGSYYLWMGANVAAPRGVTTNNYDLTTCAAIGATICFDMKYSTQAGPDPCEGIDLPAEGISVQYSTNGGATWTTIQYYDPNGGYDPILTSWNRYCLAVPAAALTTSTMFRWYQSQSSGAGFDTWGLDDMVITLTVPGYTYDWAHDVQGAQPTPATPNVAPTSSTTYTVTYTNGVETCTGSVTVNVILPTVDATSSMLNICSGSSTQLEANSSLQASPPSACGASTVACNPNNTIASEIQVGSGAVLSQTGNPGIGYLGASNFDGAVRSQFLLRATDLIAAGLTAGKFNTMQFDIASNDAGTKTFNDFEVTFMCTNQTQVSSGNYDPMSGGVTVYTSKPTTIGSGWYTIFFDQGYNWDGTTNIMINMCWRSAQSATIRTRHYNTSYPGTKTDGTNTASNGGVWQYCADESDPFTTNYNSLPNFKFGMCIPRPGTLTYTWSPTTGLDNPNIHNPLATPTTTTTYTVTVQESGTPAACIATDNVTVNVVTPNVSISSSCVAGVATLTANGTTTGTVPSGTITNSNTSSQPNYNVGTYVEKCIDVSNINPNTYPAGLANVFVNITHCDITEVTLQIKGPGGVWTTLTGLTSGGTNWTTLPAGAATSINGQWCIRYLDNCVGCGPLGINDCGGLNFNSWSITLNNAAGSNQIVEYTWSPPTDLNTTTGSVVESTSTSPITYTVTVKDAFGCITNQMITVDASNCFVLPIKLISFNAALVQKNVELIWITETEINNDYFTIERSNDANNWEELFLVNGAGNSNIQLFYTRTDKFPLNGINYYRLKQTDFNGDYSYSKIISFNNDNKDLTVAYSNNLLSVSLKEAKEKYEVQLFDISGRLIFNATSIAAKTFNLSGYSNGIYIYRIIYQNTIYSEKLVIK